MAKFEVLMNNELLPVGENTFICLHAEVGLFGNKLGKVTYMPKMQT